MKKGLGILLAIVMLVCMIPTGMAAETTASAFDLEQFQSPDTEYRPGVRWWWATGSTEESLVEQVEYLAANGFGAIEIVTYNQGFITESGSGQSADTIYPDAALEEYDNAEYYTKLEAVIERANELGLVVDLNTGTGYEANDDSVAVEDSMPTMAIGMDQIEVAADGETVSFSIPDIMLSSLFVDSGFNSATPYWSGIRNLQAIVIAPLVSDDETALSSSKVFYDPDTMEEAYQLDYLIELDSEGAVVIDMEDMAAGDEYSYTFDTAGTYQVIAIYTVPTGQYPVNGIWGEDYESYVVNHMDGDAVASFVQGWLDDDYLSEIVANYDIRAAFDDSYEFVKDIYYAEGIYELAQEDGILGYDFTPYLPIMYTSGASFFSSAATIGSLLDYADLTEDETERLDYDYSLLVSELFLEGMEAFSDALSEYGIVYRQQAYNPPIDTLTSAKYVDIPETEGLSEYDLKRVTSAAHLYGKSLITSEVFTLGSIPYANTPDDIKEGIDLMATTGVTNFFYHGLNSIYFGSEEAIADDAYGDYGWRAFPSIGIAMEESNPMSTYFEDINLYAARLNYIMSQGVTSSDVAVYMPTFGELSESDVSVTLNAYGYTWDAMSDEVIQTELTYVDGKLTTAAGTTYSSLVIADETLPVATMEALLALAEEGAPIIFYGVTPTTQPSYADGDYAALDEQVAALAQSIIALDSGSFIEAPEREDVEVTSINSWTGAEVVSIETPTLVVAELGETLGQYVDATVIYAVNEQLRYNRRTLETGEELVYLRNTSDEATEVTLTIADGYSNCYWLDQNDGSVYYAEVSDDQTITFTLSGSGAIGLLCSPDGISLSEDAVEDGLPAVIDQSTASAVYELEDFTLTVTADNFTDGLMGETQTIEYTEDVLGNWQSDDFQNGALKYVSDVGLYSTTLSIDTLDASATYVLEIADVYTAATVYVNGSEAGKIYFAPYSLDITAYLTEGENAITIEMQPLLHNRLSGFALAYESTGDEAYSYYGKYYSTTLYDAGLEGPITVSVY